MQLNKELLEIIACPVCKESVKQEDDTLVCKKCRLRYPIKEGIPVMLIEEAEKIQN